VDPLDIIHSHGSDAMRYTLCAMATNTQDVRMPVERDATTGKNTSPKFDNGRNFCNKVWNAVRFAIMNLEGQGARGEGQGARSEGQEARGKGQGEPSLARGGLLTPSSGTPGEGRGEGSLADRWILSRFNR